MDKSSGVAKAANLQTLAFWSILIFAFLVRIVGLDQVPAGINQDEAMAAMDGWALSLYGTDRYGMQLPVHFTAWEYGQMSVLLSYCMIPFIKLFGFTTFAVRLPMVFASVGAIALIYFIGRRFFSANVSLAVMAFAAINPWQFMQSRWSLDCNLFPHVFLLGFFLLLKGFERRRYLYLSMVFFGLTFYCYGVAVYTVPAFLFVYAAWCLWKKEFTWKEILMSVVIFLLVALPEILVMVINMFGLSTIKTPLFTMAYFPDSIRSNDILFLNFSFAQLGKNAAAVLTQVFLQRPDNLFNTIPAFGPLYHISTPFMVLGIVLFTKRFFTEKDLRQQTLDLSLLGFLIMGIWTGLVTYEVNVNRINIIFYPLMFFTVYGIYRFTKWLPRFSTHVQYGFVVGYAILSICFFTQYTQDFSINIQKYFNVDFLEITREADALEEFDTLYISSNVGWQNNAKMAEILTQYSLKIDALYYQERSNETGGRTLLPYSSRYHFVNMAKQTGYDPDALYIVHSSEYKDLISKYNNISVILTCGDFVAIDFVY